MADNNTPVNPTEEELLAVERMITGEAAPQAAAGKSSPPIFGALASSKHLPGGATEGSSHCRTLVPGATTD